MRGLFFFGLLTLGPAGGVLANEAASPGDFAADLAAIHIEAIGGRAKVSALSALRAEGVTRIAGTELSFYVWAKRPNLIRVESSGGPVRITRGYDGENFPWMRLGDQPAVSQPQRDAEGFVRDAEFDDPFYDPSGRGVKLAYEGGVAVHDREWFRVRETSARGTSLLYLDEAHMLVRRDRQRTIRGQEVTEETYFSDFRPVAGVLLPHLIEVRVGNNVLHETTLRRIEPNPFLLPGFFSAE